MLLKELKENNLINDQEVAELALSEVYEVTKENVDDIPLTAKSRKNIKSYTAKSKARATNHQFLADKEGNIYGVEMDIDIKFKSGGAQYSYIKLQESEWNETDYYGHTKCEFKGRTITTLVAVSLNNNVSFGDYSFPSKKLEHQVASFVQKIANRLNEKIKSQ